MRPARYAAAAFGCAALAAVAACASPSSPGIHPAGEKIPAAARAVTISQDIGPNVLGNPTAPVTITDPARIRNLTAAIAALPAFQPGTYSCPPSGAYTIVMKFSAAPGGPPLAEADDEPFGCSMLSVTGKNEPEAVLLALPPATIFTIAGLPWTVPSLAMPSPSSTP